MVLIAERPNTVTYQPATGYVFLDRTILYSADFFGPIYRTAHRIVAATHALVTWDSQNLQAEDLLRTADLHAVINGDPRVDMMSDRNISWSPLSVVGDGILTALTFVPVAPGASGLRQVGTLLAINLTTSMSMAVVDSLDIPPEIKGPLRLAVGLGVGIATGTVANRLFTGPTILVQRTAQLAGVQQRIAALRAEIRATTSTARLRQLNAQVDGLLAEASVLNAEIRSLRDLRPDLGVLEQNHERALRDVRNLENQMLAPGISRAQQAAIRTGQAMRDARTAVAEARRQLDGAYNEIHRLALRRPVDIGPVTAQGARYRRLVQGGVEVGGNGINQSLQARAERALELALERLGLSSQRQNIEIVFSRTATEPVTEIVNVGGRNIVRITIDYATLASRSRYRLLVITHEAAHAERWFMLVQRLGESRALEAWNRASIWGSRSYALDEILVELRARNAIRDLLNSDVIQYSEAYVRLYIYRYRTGNWRGRP